MPLIEDVVSSYEEMKVYYVTLAGNQITVYIELTDAKIRQKAKQKTVFEIETAILDQLSFMKSE